MVTKLMHKDYLSAEMLKFLGRHPFVVLAVCCFLCIFLTSSEQLNIIGAGLPVLIFLLGGLTGARCVCSRVNEKSRRTLRISLSIITLVFAVIFYQLLKISLRPQLVLLCTGTAVTAAAGTYLFCIKKMTAKRLAVLLFIIGFLMRLAYIMTVGVKYKQHDIGSIEKRLTGLSIRKKRQAYQLFVCYDFVGSAELGKRVTDKAVGKSPKQIIAEYIMHEAVTLLENSRLTIQEISDSLGFSSQAMFSKFFRNNCGKSPTQVRKDY